MFGCLTFRSQQKSLEHASVRRLYLSMFGNDHRFIDPSPEEIDALSLEGMMSVVSKQLITRDMEISIVGDIEASEVDDLVLKYLGTVKAAPDPELIDEVPIVFATPTAEERHQVWHLQVCEIFRGSLFSGSMARSSCDEFASSSTSLFCLGHAEHVATIDSCRWVFQRANVLLVSMCAGL